MSSIQKIKLRFDRDNFQNKNILFSLDKNEEYEVEDDMNFYEKEEIENNINPIESSELLRYKPKNTYTINFNINSSTDWVSSNLFTENQLLLGNPQVKNSFFILDLFNLDNSSYSTRLYTGFFRVKTKTLYTSNDLCTRKPNGIETDIKVSLTQDDINSFLFAPERFINNYPQNLFLKLRFFYAITGKIYNFTVSQQTRPSFNNEKDVYIPIFLNDDKTYELGLPNILMNENTNPNLNDSNPDSNFQISFNENTDKEIITETGEYL